MNHENVSLLSDEYERFAHVDELTERSLVAILPDRISVNVGRLTIETKNDHPCCQVVMLDGKPFPVQSLTLHLEVGAIPQVTATFLNFRKKE